MVYAGKLWNPIRQAFTVVNTSSKSLQLRTLHGEFEPLKTWRKILEPYLHSNFSRFSDRLNIQRKYIQNFSLSGSISVGGIFGVSVIFGSISFRPHVAYAMDGRDVLLDDYQIDLLSASDSENDSLAFWTFLRKFWLPAFFLLTVLVNWDHPITLVTKIVLLLLGTKPSPLSVYIYVEQLCHQSMRQKPHVYIFKDSLLTLIRRLSLIFFTWFKNITKDMLTDFQMVYSVGDKME